MTRLWSDVVRTSISARRAQLRYAVAVVALIAPASAQSQAFHPATAKTLGCSGWETKFKGSTAPSNSPIKSLGCDRYYIGDFNGDGVDEVLTVDGLTGSDSKMSVMRFNSSNNTWSNPPLWSVNGDPHDGGIYDYRANLVVGDFDGDNKDEVLGVAPGSSNAWITMFHFESNTWVFGWSNGGDESAGGGIYPYRNYLTAGHFDASDDRDYLLGGGGWVTMFRFDGTDFVWRWSTGTSHGMLPYAFSKCYVGDLDADGQDDVIYVSSGGGPITWATSFYWTGTDWFWGWSNGTTSGLLLDWPYPIGSDRLLVGNIDGDASHEMLFIQRNYNATCSEAMQFPVGQGYLPPVHGWDNDQCYCPWFDTWKMSGGVGTLTDYYLMRTSPGAPKSLLARREYEDDGYYAIGVINSIGAK